MINAERMKIILCCTLLLLSTSCATLLGSRHNTLSFEAATGAVPAEVWLDGEMIGEAPGAIRLPARRIQHGSVLELKVEGEAVQTHVLQRKFSSGYFWLDLATTFGVALAIDMGTGYIYRPWPRRFSYESDRQNP